MIGFKIAGKLFLVFFLSLYMGIFSKRSVLCYSGVVPKKPKAQKALLIKSLTRLGAVLRARARTRASEREEETDKQTKERERVTEDKKFFKNSRQSPHPPWGRFLYKKLYLYKELRNMLHRVSICTRNSILYEKLCAVFGLTTIHRLWLLDSLSTRTHTDIQTHTHYLG